jgi:hypothetical protein
VPVSRRTSLTGKKATTRFRPSPFSISAVGTAVRERAVGFSLKLITVKDLHERKALSIPSRAERNSSSQFLEVDLLWKPPYKPEFASFRGRDPTKSRGDELDRVYWRGCLRPAFRPGCSKRRE